MAAPAKKKGEPALGLLIGMAEPKGKTKPDEEMSEDDDGSGEAFDVAADELFPDEPEKKDALKRAIEACMKGY